VKQSYFILLALPVLSIDTVSMHFSNKSSSQNPLEVI